jgi:hypothetical protein
MTTEKQAESPCPHPSKIAGKTRVTPLEAKLQALPMAAQVRKAE